MRTILMDSREPDSMYNELSKLGVPVDKKRLPSGDYVIGDIGLERKAMSDFFGSLRDGRIFDQVKYLCETYPRKALIIEGKITPRLALRFKKLKGNLQSKIKFLRHRLEGFKTGMFIGFYLPIFETNDQEDTAWLLANLHTKIMDKTPFERPIPIVKTNLRPEQIREEMIALIPGIGRKGSRILLKASNDTVSGLINAKEEELLSLKGIGKERVLSIKKVLT